jgi:hypothetical protein
MAEIGRILTALGSVAATVGLVVYGMGRAFVRDGDFEITVGLWLMVAGVIATIIGLVLYSRTAEPEG